MPGNRKYGVVGLILVIIAALAVLSNIPLLYGYLNQRPGLRFMGIIAGVRDSNFYFMMMRQADGWWPVLTNYFAPGEPNRIYHGFFWFFLGKIARIFRTGGLAPYHGARLAAIIFFVPIAYYFVSRFLRTTAERVTALIMLSFGAGLGWIQLIRYYRTGFMSFTPTDIGTPEASSSFTFMTFPHLAIALVLIMLCFSLVEDSVAREKIWPALLAGVCGFILGFIHAVNLVVIYVALASFAFVSLVLLKQKWPIRAMIAFGALSVWPIAYYVYLSLTGPDLLPQAPVRSSTPLAYLVGFAPFVILGLIHIGSLIRKRSLPREDLFLICWAVTNSLLLYSYPILSQEARAVLGLQAPLVVLSVRAIFGTILPLAGLDWQTAAVSGKKLSAILVVALIVIFTFPSTFGNIIERVSRLRSSPQSFSLTRDEYEALRFIHDAPQRGVVLSGDRVGNYVPRLTGRFSWLGQYDLPSHDSRLSMTKSFFAAETPGNTRKSFLKEHDIAYIVYGPEEKALGTFDPRTAGFLRQVFQSASVTIYQYEPQQASEKGTHSL